MSLKKTIFAFLAIGVMLYCSGCNKNIDVFADPPVNMVQVTHESKPDSNSTDHVTFTFNLPSDWTVYNLDYISCCAMSNEYANYDFGNDNQQYLSRLYIQRYLEPGTTIADLDTDMQ